MKKLFIAAFLVAFGPWRPAMATWDETTPAGTEAKSLGDDRIRELKVDVRTALDVEGVFPGTTTASPKFFYTPSTGTTSQRPVGDYAPQGRLFINKTSSTLEQANSDGSWSALSVVPSSGITPVEVANTVAGDGLGGGAGAPLHVQINSSVFAISNDSITFASTINIATAVTFSGGVSFSRSGFRVQAGHVIQTIAANGTITFNSESFDTLGEINNSTFTAQATGTYMFAVGIYANSPSDSTYVTPTLSGSISLASYCNTDAATDIAGCSSTWVTRLTAGDSVYVTLGHNGTGSSVVNGSSNIGTYFSGARID